MRALLSSQIVRFGLVGVGSNLALYLAFVLLLHIGVAYAAAMTATYLGGVALGFWLHRNWTFRTSGLLFGSAVRYGIAYVGGYALNFLGLMLLVERARWSAANAQGAMVVIVAGFLFLVQKYWVFGVSRARRFAPRDA